MKSLVEIFKEHSGKVAHKHPIHLEAYDKFFNAFRGAAAGILEIGIGNGGSLQLWRSYFGSEARISGLDIVDLKYLEKDIEAEIFTGSQDNDALVCEVVKKTSPLNVVIDDGSHFSRDQIRSFETIFPLLEDGGFYVCEDTHTSYRELYAGGLKREGTFIEYVKGMVDSLHRSEIPMQDFPYIWDHVFAVHFYPNLVIIEKRSPGSWGGAEMRGR